MSYTPGPWFANAVKNGRITGDCSDATQDAVVEYDKIQINNHNATVATVYRRNDARLIAAAPELYEACKLAVFNEKKADDLRNSGMVDNVDIKALRSIASAARAAIAKAEGN